jgi:hypothetical protein
MISLMRRSSGSKTGQVFCVTARLLSKRRDAREDLDLEIESSQPPNTLVRETGPGEKRPPRHAAIAVRCS